MTIEEHHEALVAELAEVLDIEAGLAEIIGTPPEGHRADRE
ncbi:hypothetical protein [Nocardia brasiliensis]